MRPVLTSNEKNKTAIDQICQMYLFNKNLFNIIWEYTLEFEMICNNKTTILNRKSFYRFKAILYCEDLADALHELCIENIAYKTKFGKHDLRGAGIIQIQNEVLYDLSQQTPIMIDSHDEDFPDNFKVNIENAECFNLHFGFTYTRSTNKKTQDDLKLKDYIQYPISEYPIIKLFYRRTYFRHEYSCHVISLIDEENTLFFAENYN